MPIDNFRRVANYFNTSNTLKAGGVDSQFNLISDYLDNKVVPILNKLISDSIPGSVNPADINKFLQNVGDGTTTWSAINSDSIADGGLAFSKLARANPGSILASGANQILRAVTPTETNQVLVSVANDAPIWRKLVDADIEERSIKANHIAPNSIRGFNVAPNVLNTQLINNTIDNAKLKDRSIKTVHLQNGFATDAKFSNSTLIRYTYGTIRPDWLPDWFIMSDKIEDGSIHLASMKPDNINLGVNHIKDNAFTFAHIADQQISSGHITPGAIGVNMYEYYPADRPDPIYGLYNFAPTTFIDWSTFPRDNINNWIQDQTIDETFFPPKVRAKIV